MDAYARGTVTVYVCVLSPVALTLYLLCADVSPLSPALHGHPRRDLCAVLPGHGPWIPLPPTTARRVFFIAPCLNGTPLGRFLLVGQLV